MITSENEPRIVEIGTNKGEQNLVRAIAWTGGTMWVTQLLSWTSTIYVARILSPSDYGLFALAAVYLGLVALISELGIGSAVIVLRELRRRELAELNTVSVIAGFLWLALSAFFAPYLGQFFATPELSSVIVAMSLAFLISSFKIVPDSVLRQQLRFKLLSHIEGIKSVVQAITTIVSAFAGLRYWSLVVGYLVGTSVETILTLAFLPHPFAWPNLKSMKPALRLSRDMLVSRICWYSYSNSDFVIAGRLLGQAPLGAYRLAWSISNMPVDKISSMVMRTSQAFFSSAQKDYDLLRRYLLGLTEGLAMVTIPVSVGIILTADQFVPLVLGARWDGAILPLRLLAAYAAVRSLTPLIPSLLMVTGNSAFTARVTFWTSLILPLGFYIGAQWGATGIAAAWVIMYPLSVIPLYMRALPQIGLSYREYFATLAAPFGGTVFLTIAVLVLKYTLGSRVPLLIGLALQATTGIVAYVVFIFVFYRERVRAFTETAQLLRRTV